MRWLIAFGVLFLNSLVYSQTGESPPSLGKRVALVIGNGGYQSTDMPRLKNPTNDAEDIAEALRGFKFEVIDRKDLNKRQMKDVIAEFSRKAAGADAALFFFAGHGVQIRGQNYLLPVSASLRIEADVEDEGVSLNYLLDALDEAHSKVNIVVLDACRNNPLGTQFRSGSGRGLAAPSAVPKGTVVVFATDPGNTADDGSGRNGLLTSGLLAGFKGEDLSLDGVLTTASAAVEQQSSGRQTPYVNGPKTIQKVFQFSVTVNPGARQIERDFWASIKDSRDPADFASYLTKYPKGEFTDLAGNRVNALRRDAQAAAAAAAAAASRAQALPDPALAEMKENIRKLEADRARAEDERRRAEVRADKAASEAEAARQQSDPGKKRPPIVLPPTF
jgi:hypothetical protein